MKFRRRSPENLIDAAVVILREMSRPSTAREIVAYGLQRPELARFFGGRTPYKTLNARISVDILMNGEASQFFRCAPAFYGLRERLDNKTYDANFRRVYIGRNRRKEVSNELVAVVDADKLQFFKLDGLYTDATHPLDLLGIIGVRYVERRVAENTAELKQLVSYAFIQHQDCVLAFERGRYTSDGGEFIGKQSIGFGGHVNYNDASLFDHGPVGLDANLRRELHEELYIFSKELRHAIDSVRFCGFLVDTSTDNGKKHLGLAACITLNHRIQLETPTLGICNLRWISARHTPNSFDRFEIWSQYLFRYLQSTHRD